METKFNFKSQICTDRNQSERLLALGLKKETADMVWLDHALTEDYDDWRSEPIYKDWEGWQKDGIPAWSIYEHKFCLGTNKDKIIEVGIIIGSMIGIIGTIAWFLKKIKSYEIQSRRPCTNQES